MTSWSAEPGKIYVDKVVEDLQFVRDNYKQGAKDKVHFADKHIIEIANAMYLSCRDGNKASNHHDPIILFL